MRLHHNVSDVAFRSDVRYFLATLMDSERYEKARRSKGAEAFRLAAELLAKKNWTAPNWPKEWGGGGLTPVQSHILEDELMNVDFPQRDRIAINLAGPVIYTFGTPEQKQRYLPRILSGTEIWCQGFSEPNAGSDVNALRTRATLRNNVFIVEGSKIWTTNAHIADMMFALVRVCINNQTQRGLTFLLIDMKDPAISIRPIQTLDGRHHFNEVFLDQVQVPANNVVGELGRGWQNARFLLSNERLLFANSAALRRRLLRIKRRLSFSEHTTYENAIGRGAKIQAELMALEFMALRILYAPRADPLIEGLRCALKIKGAELRQRLSELEFDVCSRQSKIISPNLEVDDLSQQGSDTEFAVTQEFLFDLSASIAGGTTEIQKNLIAGITLGME